MERITWTPAKLERLRLDVVSCDYCQCLDRGDATAAKRMREQYRSDAAALEMMEMAINDLIELAGREPQ